MRHLAGRLAEDSLLVCSGGVELEGNIRVPDNAQGIVLFAHGSGSSRFSPRNQFVADVLNRGGLGTLLIDLLSPGEEAIDVETGQLRFDIEFLASRLYAAVNWLGHNDEARRLKIGLFGSSTGGGAALVAAARQGDRIGAVVSRGGRPDLAGSALADVRSPTLLIVGGNDSPVIQMNREAFDQLRCTKEMKIVPGASHLFEEAGTLEKVADLARDWFRTHLSHRPSGK